MRVALYARVSTEAQEARGTIGSQLELLRERVGTEGHELVGEFCDDGYSGARLDRPGLDAMRDQAEAGAFEAVWCLSADRLARAYAYQVLIVDELARFGVRVVFVDSPALDDNPQARLLAQVQGVIAEYERAKIAERYRRGKLYRSRLGEVISWKAPYGYRRLPRDKTGPARLEVFEPEAAVVRRIFSDYVAGGHAIRRITRLLNSDGIPTPTGNAVWGTSIVNRLLRNEAYVGRVYFNKTEAVPTISRTGRRSNLQRPRPREDWVAIPCPAIVPEEVFEAAQRVSHDNSQWSPRHLKDEAWLLRGLVKCGACKVGTRCHKMSGRDGTIHRYYYCANHDTIRARGEADRCPERNIHADALDAFVFEQVRAALLRPEVLLAGESALTAAQPVHDDELLSAELARLARKIDMAEAAQRRLADLYQSGLPELVEVQHRAKEIDSHHRSLVAQKNSLVARRRELAADNQLRRRVSDFAQKVTAGIDQLDFDQRQQLLRLLVDQVLVSGWRVEIQLRIPLDEDSGDGGGGSNPAGPAGPSGRSGAGRRARVSSKDGLRSVRGDRWSVPAPGGRHGWQRGGASHLEPGKNPAVRGEFPCPSLGRSSGRARGLLVAVHGEFSCPPVGRSPWPLTPGPTGANPPRRCAVPRPRTRLQGEPSSPLPLARRSDEPSTGVDARLSRRG